MSRIDGTLWDVLLLFGFHPFEERGIAFYRPLFRELLYHSFYSLFGLNHFPFRIFSFLIHFVNIALIYALVEKIFQKRTLAFFTAFFFGIASANVALLYYLAGGIQALGATMFSLLTLLFFWKYLSEDKVLFKHVAFGTFVLSLGSHELAAVTPLLLFGIYSLQKKISLLNLVYGLKQLFPFLVVLLIYLYLDFTLIGFSSGEKQYQMIFSLKPIVNSLSWYTVWAIGAPEMLIDFVQPGLKLNPSLMRHWSNYYSIIFAYFLLTTGTFVTLLLILLKNKKNILRDKRFWLLLVWFPVGIAPVILLPLHKSTYYLALSLPAFWSLVGYLLLESSKSKFGKFLFGGFITAVVVLNIASIKVGDSTYWAASRGRIAERLINQVKSVHPRLPKGAVVYFKNDPDYPFVAQDWGGTSKQAAFVLNGSDALQLLYKDPALKVYYEDTGIPDGFLQGEVMEITAKID